MNAIILLIIAIPLIEIYLMIKVGGIVGAFNTIFLIFFTAVTGVYFAKLQGLKAMKTGFEQILKNETPIYEMISGAALTFAAALLIFPGFLTDLIGFLLIIPVTRKIFIKGISLKFRREKEDRFTNKNENIIEGTIEEENEKEDK